MLCLGLKAMLFTEMLAEAIRVPVCLAAQTTNQVENVTRRMAANNVLDGFVFGDIELPLGI